MTPSHELRLQIDECDADLARVRVMLARSIDADEIGALASLVAALRKRRRELLEAHMYATARELADLAPTGWRPARPRPVFGALMGRNSIPLHTNWRTR